MKRKIAFLLTIVMMATLMGIHAQALVSTLPPEEWQKQKEEGLAFQEKMEAEQRAKEEAAKQASETPAPTPRPQYPPGFNPETDHDEYVYTQEELDWYYNWAEQAQKQYEEQVGQNKNDNDTPPVAVNTPAPTNKHYEDVPSNAWYAEAVNAMTEGGLLKGYDDGLFHPTDLVTQGQFATILCRLMGLPEIVEKLNEPGFTWRTGDRWFGGRDVSLVHWAQHPIMSLSTTARYLIPQGGETADDPVWRADAIDMMTQTAHWTKYKPNGRSYFIDANYTHGILTSPDQKVWTENDIPDWDAIAYDDLARTWEHADGSPHDMRYAGHVWDKGFILDAYNLGFTKGIDDAGTCNPEGELTRAELAQMLYNAGWVKYGCATKH